MTFDLGQKIRFSVEFTNNSGAFANPTTVVFKIKDPLGNIVTYTGGNVVNSSTGNYYLDYPIPAQADFAGGWEYRWEGTGTVVAADEGEFDVRESAFYS